MSLTSPNAPRDLPELILQPSRGWQKLNLGELWAYRELLYFLIWRDVKVRYKQTLIGAAWAIIQPFMTMIVFSIFFGQLAGIQSDGVPYPIFSYTALVPWAFFANGLTNVSNSLVSSGNLIKKVYFPRLVIPLAGVLSGLVDFALAFAVLVVMMLLYGIVPTAALITLPLFVLLALITSLAVGLWLSALNVQFRDVRYVLPFLIQFWLFATPIAYPSSLIENPLVRALYGLNPMAGVVEGFRWALLGSPMPPLPMLLASTVMALIGLISGLFYFRRMEKFFADVV